MIETSNATCNLIQVHYGLCIRCQAPMDSVQVNLAGCHGLCPNCCREAPYWPEEVKELGL